MTIQQYIESVNRRFKLGNGTEHTFRGDLQQLIESMVPGIRATNEPKRQSCGAPDYIITKNEIPLGFIEAKDIGDTDLQGEKKNGNKEQFDRYKASLNNLIFTDYLRFYVYRDGQLLKQVAIGEMTDKGIKPLPENFGSFENTIRDFCTHIGQTITSSKKLAEMMAGKARLLSGVIEHALNSDESNHEDSTLKDQMKAFKEILIHDITPKGFADVYAQTITYGMFAARLHDPTLPTFSRQEAFELIPKSNPFLKKLFGYIAGLELDERIKWIVDDLVQIFLACNVEDMLKTYGKSTKTEDPIIHFYEDFLSEYDPRLRKARGVWYTPQPVVNFIVRAVDDILKTEFGLPQGLADTSKTRIKTEVQGKPVEREVHKVQILDPATGTGTFLAEVVKHIHRRFEGQEGIWSNYVENHLIPRLNGFELLMASYAMAHLKLDLLLKETGYQPTTNQRFRVYLTNSLEEASQERPNLFMSQWLTEEGIQADAVKRDTPVMCVIGNPPYSISSSNKGEWIENLTCDYKKELNEKNIQALSDDYIKFIRFGHYYVEKNGYGILAYISNNSFVDGVIHRKMRENLLKSFDEIYIIDLHGSTKKREKAADGGIDENVFDIMQGVSINIFVKSEKKQKNAIANIYHFDLFGKRQFKYDFLSSNDLKSIIWKKINPFPPFFFFTNKELNINNSSKAFEIASLFHFFNSGLTTEFDEVAIQENKAVSETLLNNLLTKSTEDIANIYNLNYSKYSKKISNAIKDLSSNKSLISEIYYRPFESKFTIYTGKSNGIMGRPRTELMKHFISKNIGLVIGRQGQAVGGEDWNIVTITKTFTDSNIFRRGRGTVFPLYLYPETNAQKSLEPTTERTPNLNMDMVRQIAEKLGLAFVPEKPHTPNPSQEGNFAPIDLLDYIYAVLHSPTYREKYKEFLKIDFPRVPYPKDAATFWQLVKLGGEIRQIHLLESPTVEKYITRYPVNGDNAVGKIRFELTPDPSQEGKSGRVYINDTQYFAHVPETAWNFYIGGYQPAQKWLKDRKERTLDFEDILHYQKIIVALTETDRLMKEIDKIELE
jgi:predicted helicase